MTTTFKKFGAVESVRVRSIPIGDPKLPRKAALIKKSFHEDRDSMNAYVVFEEEAGAKAALEFDGQEINGKKVHVDLAGNKEHDSKHSVFVGNLPFSMCLPV